MALSASQAIDTPNSGKFMYLELDNQVDFPVTKLIKDTSFHGMYHVNVFAGSKNTKTELWLTSQEHQVSFLSPEMTNAQLNGGWDPKMSHGSKKLTTGTLSYEDGQVYDFQSDGKKILANRFVGSHWNDTFKFVDPSTSHHNENRPTLKSDLKFMSVTKADNAFSTEYDGFVGIAPFSDDSHLKQYNFMYQMKQKGHIDHLVASLFISKNY